MKTYIMFFLLALINSFCNNQDKQDCDLTHSFELKSEGFVINLPSYRILDSIIYTGFDKTIVYNYQLKISGLAKDSLISFVTAHNYNYPETKHLLNFNYFRDKIKNETEYLLTEKNIIIDTIINIGSLKVGYMKYLVDPKKTNYAEKSGQIHYDSKIFFFKQNRAVEIEIIEMYKSEKLNKQSLTDCILQNLKFNV